MEPAPKGILLLTGTIGAGKTTVAIEAGRQLENIGLPCAVIDWDWLGWVHVGDQFHAYDQLALQNLFAIWPNLHTVGVEYLILARGLMHRQPIDDLLSHWQRTPLTIVRLYASSRTLQERLSHRDVGETLQEHLGEVEAMTAALDHLKLEHATVNNDGRSIEDVAGQVLTVTAWKA
jgi:broad-specificity NMP kinase